MKSLSLIEYRKELIRNIRAEETTKCLIISRLSPEEWLEKSFCIEDYFTTLRKAIETGKQVRRIAIIKKEKFEKFFLLRLRKVYEDYCQHLRGLQALNEQVRAFGENEIIQQINKDLVRDTLVAFTTVHSPGPDNAFVVWSQSATEEHGALRILLKDQTSTQHDELVIYDSKAWYITYNKNRDIEGDRYIECLETNNVQRLEDRWNQVQSLIGKDIPGMSLYAYLEQEFGIKHNEIQEHLNSLEERFRGASILGIDESVPVAKTAKTPKPRSPGNEHKANVVAALQMAIKNPNLSVKQLESFNNLAPKTLSKSPYKERLQRARETGNIDRPIYTKDSDQGNRDFGERIIDAESREEERDIKIDERKNELNALIAEQTKERKFDKGQAKKSSHLTK